MVSNDEKMLKERIRHLLSYKKASVSDLTDNVTLQVRYRRQINGDAAVPFSTLYKILYMYHDISADWLILGEGSMQKADHVAPHIHHNNYNNQLAPGSTQTGPVAIGHDTVNVIRGREIEERDILIKQQAERIAELEKDKELLSGLLSAFTDKPK
ncbi:MAG: hypothetical protein IKA00_03985 [Prevotella sp.]|nr:hypothetical protein [Prevotella sp.]MBR3858499.1 hypothetical protein [Bacteroidaceae bacterium]